MAERPTPIATRSTTPALYPITLVRVNAMSAGCIRMQETLHEEVCEWTNSPGVRSGLLMRVF
jgi:hypothetical protein